MTLGDRRRLFTLNFGLLIVWAVTHGYELAIDDAKRPRTNSYSLHPDGLAVDLNLYIKRRYQRTTAAHRPLGQFWKSLHPYNRWGGDFKDNPDGNHYSMTYLGRA